MFYTIGIEINSGLECVASNSLIAVVVVQLIIIVQLVISMCLMLMTYSPLVVIILT